MGVAADTSCDVCPNAAPHANAQASALLTNNLVITPPREVLPLFPMDSAENAA
jgi:hypothetical protein